MLEPQFVQRLRCPESHAPLQLADAALLARVNAAIGEGRVRRRNGQKVEEPLEAALVRADGAVLFPVVDDIPVLLLDEAIPLDQGNGAVTA